MLKLKHGDLCPSARTLREAFVKYGFSLRAIVPEGKKLAPDELAKMSALRIGYSYAPEKAAKEGHLQDRISLSAGGDRLRAIKSISINPTGIVVVFYVGDSLVYDGHEGFARNVLGTLSVIEGLPLPKAPAPAAAPSITQQTADAVTAAMAAATAAGTTSPPLRDDLKRIRGIGVLLEKKLNAFGVTSYAQIARWNEGDLREAALALGFDGGRIARENWIEQARVLASGGLTEFARRVDRGL